MRFQTKRNKNNRGTMVTIFKQIKKVSFEHVSEGLKLRAIIPDIGKLNSF